MKSWIALLRGINVLGRHKVSMQELTAVFERAGYLEVRTYIQSGNVVFKSARGRASEHSSQITQLIGERFGFAAHVMVISGSELAKAVRENPFKDAHRDHRCLHLFFLSEVADKS